MLNEDVVKNINKLNNEQDNINLELSKKASKEDLDKLIQGGTNVAISKDISTNDWILEESTYTTIVEHNLVTRKVLVSLIDKTTNNNIFCSYQILDDNRIKVFNESNNELECIVVNGNSAINMVSATIDDNRSTETTTYSSIKIEDLLKALENKIDDIENLKEVDNIKCSTDTGEYTIENSKKGYLTNFNIEGKTLVNLANPNNVYTTDGVRYNNPFKYIESGKTYTFINLSDKQIKYIYGGIENLKVEAKSKVLYTIPDNINIPEILCYGHAPDGWGETDVDKQQLSKSMLILEGDCTSKDIEYFDGLQSVGQGDNIELFSCKEDINIIPNNITWKDGYFLNRNDNLEYESKHYSYTLDYIPVKADTDYTLIYANWNILLYDKDKNIINFGYPNPSISINGLGDKVSEGLFFIKTTSNSCYMRMSVPTRYKGRIIISEGVKFDKKVIPYTLRSLPNSIKDEITYKNNAYKLIQKCEEITINGQENWTELLENATNETLLFNAPLGANINGAINNINLYCDKFKPYAIWGVAYNFEGIYETKTNIWIRILKSRLETQDLSGFKTWLNNNHVTLVRQIETKEIELGTLNLEQYNNQTMFICESGITPDTSFESTQNLGNHIEVIRSNIKALIDTQRNTHTINLANKLLNGWTLFSDVHRGIVVTRNGNVVTIIGSIKGGIISNETIICKIPEDMIPNSNQLFQTFNTIGTPVGLLYVNSAGDFKINSLTSNTAVIINAQYILD
ncbi:hypothetical protein Q3304_12500 [Clostridioides sp. GD02377]|uniref:hypothetical protein n=1 Tax=unclassified Clostridioides TaxID=2635829 RepID=UPI00389E9C32